MPDLLGSTLWWQSGKEHAQLLSIDEEALYVWDIDVSGRSVQVCIFFEMDSFMESVKIICLMFLICVHGLINIILHYKSFTVCLRQINFHMSNSNVGLCQILG